MKRFVCVTSAFFFASSAVAEVVVDNAIIPLAPPGVMTHAAYFDLTNTDEETRVLVGVTASGYAMAHLHQSAESNGVATMSAVHQIAVPAGQTLRLEPGGLHVMLMHPANAQNDGQVIDLSLEFANGQKLEVPAVVTRGGYGS